MTTTLPPSGDTPAELAEHLASGARLVEAFHLMPGVARAMREAACLLRELSAKMIDPAPVAPCIGNDPACPCQDGELCHYKDSPDGKTKAMPVPPAPDIGDWVWGWLADYCKRNGIPAAQSDLFALCSDIRKVYPAAPAPETVAWMIVEPGCECGPIFGTENAAWSALTKAPPGSELIELIRRPKNDARTGNDFQAIDRARAPAGDGWARRTGAVPARCDD